MPGLQLQQVSPGPTANAAGVQNPPAPVAGFLQNLNCTATFVGGTAPATLAWQVAGPTYPVPSRVTIIGASGQTIQQGVQTSVLSVVIQPDVAGIYVLTGTDPNGIVYSVQILVQPTAGTFFPGTLSPIAVTPSQVITPAAGQEILFCDATNGGRLSKMDSSRNVSPVIAGLNPGTANGQMHPVQGSFCVANVGESQWGQASPLSSATPVALNDLQDNAPFADSVLLNPFANASTGDQRSWRVCAPPGATSLTFSIRAKLPQGVGSSTIAFAWFTASFGSNLIGTTAVLTASYVTYTLTLNSVTPGTEYNIFLAANRASMGCSTQAQAEIDTVSITATGATGVFAGGAFTRLQVYPHSLLDNAEDPTEVTDRGYRHSAFSRIVFDTNASQFAVELWNGVFSTYPAAANLAIYVNGRYFSTIAGQGTDQVGTLYYVTVDVSAIPGHKRVEIMAGANVDFSNPGPGTAGTFLRAIYIPTGIAAQHVIELARQEIIIVGDSIAQGFKTTNDAAKAWCQKLRTYYPGRVVSDGAGIRSLFTIGGTATQRQTLAQRLGQRQPAHIWIELGINDWRGSYWANAAAFGAAYADLVAKIHAYSPGTKIYCQAPNFQLGESGMDQYRSQVIATAWANPTFCTPVYAHSWLAPADMDADNLHFTNAGEDRFLVGVLGTLGLDAVQPLSAWVPKNGRYTYTTATLWEGWEAQDVALGAITSWNGHWNGVNLTSVTGSPTMTAALTPNGGQACVFGSATDRLQTPSLTLSSSPSGLTIVCVYKPNQAIGAAGSNDSIFDGRTNQTAWLVNTTDLKLFLSTAGSNAGASFNASQGNWAVIGVVINAANSLIQDLDSVPTYNRSGALNFGAATSLGGFTLGNMGSGGRSQRGYMPACYVFTGAMSAQELVYFIEGYVKPTWGLS